MFSDKTKLTQLNKLVHDEVISEIRRQRDLYFVDKNIKAIIYDVPLLLETDLESDCNYLVFVECDEQTRSKRFAQRTGLDKKELDKRQKTQILLDKKKNIANYTIINNSLDKGSIVRQVGQILSEIFLEFNTSG